MKCVIGNRILTTNKHITVTKTTAKVTNSVATPTKQAIIARPKNNNVDTNKRKFETIQTANNGGFRKKIKTGEITIVPITSPKSNNSPSFMNKPCSIEVSPIIQSNNVLMTKPTPVNPVPSSVNPVTTPVKRITPITISREISVRSQSVDKSTDSDAQSKDSFATNDDDTLLSNQNGNESTKPATSPKVIKTPINDSFNKLIEACRKADPSPDMEKLINRKLIRYYQSVHPNFVNSKSFQRNVMTVCDEINAQPDYVYLKIDGLLEELKTRRATNPANGQISDVTEEAPEIESTGNKSKDIRIRKLNRALHILKRKIKDLEEAEVDFDDDFNSKYLICERYKKRAVEIFRKICDLTGESESAERKTKKPIKFNGTKYNEFNKTLQNFVNTLETFPDMFDVLKLMEHCNSKYNYGLSKDHCQIVGESKWRMNADFHFSRILMNFALSASDAFVQIGTALQKRRKIDLYEMVSYYTGTAKDPALEDKELQSKLNENQKYHNRIIELIDK